MLNSLESSVFFFFQKILSWVCMGSFGVSVSDVNEIFGRWVNQGTFRRRPGAHVGRLAATGVARFHFLLDNRSTVDFILKNEHFIISWARCARLGAMLRKLAMSKRGKYVHTVAIFFSIRFFKIFRAARLGAMFRNCLFPKQEHTFT